MEQNRIVIMLAAILLAAVAVSVGVLYFVPGDKSSAPQPQPIDTNAVTTTNSAGLNLDVLQKASYQALDAKSVENGSLPVQPPTGVGKANPFI